MTALEPTERMELEGMRTRLADLHWGFERLVELMALEADGLRGCCRDAVIGALMGATRRLALENEARQAKRTRAHNAIDYTQGTE